MTANQKITPCLWFDGNAEEAINHYISVFRSGRILEVARCGEGGPGPKGSILTARFELAGQQYLALNGGPMFKFTEAISLSVDCQSQAEVDKLWEALSAGGSKSQCGWLKDKFGLSWQIVPSRLPELLTDPDSAKSHRVMAVLMTMTKLDIAQLEAAYDGR
jgi:predicted 3-demethylubiquinone-9 3-methyltransferase (glyoxalase superfamily)